MPPCNDRNKAKPAHVNPKVLSISLPEYSAVTEPDYVRIGDRVDNFLARNLQDGTYFVRAISLADHPGKTIDELASLILASGTDRYDLDRETAEPEFDGYDYDLHLSTIGIHDGELNATDGSSGDELLAEHVGLQPQDCSGYFAGVCYRFRELIPVVRGISLRVDLLTLYDPHQFEPAEYVDQTIAPVGQLARYLHRFRHPSSKQEAVTAIVKIL